MGNSQASATKVVSVDGVGSGGVSSSSSATFGGSIKSRRGSKVKVFGLLGQKKFQKEPATPTTPTAVADTPQIAGINAATTRAIGCVESIDEEEAQSQQKHDIVARQLEFEQMEIRGKKASGNENKSELFTKCKRNISDNNYGTEKVPVHKKRPAPKPTPITTKTTTHATNDNIKLTSQTQNRLQSIIDSAHTDYNRKFIEHLFDSSIEQETLENEKTDDHDQNIKAKHSRDNVIREAAEDQTTTTSVLTIQQKQAYTNNRVSSRTFPILTGNTTSERRMVIDEPSDQLLNPQSHRHQLQALHERDTILRDTFCENNDFDDEFQNNQMATSLTMMMTMMGGSHPHYSFNNDNCDIVVLRDLSSSSDSLFTDPLTPPQSTTSLTAPLGSAVEQCSTSDELDDDADNNIDDVETVERKRNQTHISTAFCTPTLATQIPTTIKQLTASTTTPVTRASAATTSVKEKQRPLSETSINSGDTSGILSPTTAKAILELQKRHQADKLSLLSIAKTTYLELLPTGIESSPELETESPDEQMALHLGKKLAQVLSGGSGSGAGNGNSNMGSASGGATGTPGSPMQDNLTCCSVITGNEMFNIAKAKKIELPSLSSRLVATAPPMPTPIEAQTTATSRIMASTDAKHLPTLQSATQPTYSTSASANNTTSPTTETQSTVIISFKSSQTPVQSQPPLTIAGAYEHPQHQQQLEHSTTAITTPLRNDDTIAETMTHTPSFSPANSSHGSTTAQMGSPIFTPKTPKNNVLKKVASFTIEKSAGGGANSKANNSDPNSGVPGQLENIGSKRSTYVPEKLSFAAYEKFEGKFNPA